LDLNEVPPHDAAPRTDIKFVLPLIRLPGLLLELAPFYKVLAIDGCSVFAYATRYFDTPGFDMYMAHHNGRLNRFKIRERSYLDSEQHYLEIKFKSNRYKTSKQRIMHTPGEPLYLEPAAGFITAYTPYDPQTLAETVCVNYFRITLADPGTGEKITIDSELEFSGNNSSNKLSNFVVAEIKQFAKARTPALELMENRRLRPVAFSKYCFGINCLYPQLKNNNFKPKWKALTKNLHDQFINPVTII
jgi:hypothetical protein